MEILKVSDIHIYIDFSLFSSHPQSTEKAKQMKRERKKKNRKKASGAQTTTRRELRKITISQGSI